MKKREERLILGKGQYADDLEFFNMAHLVFVGSPHAHAKIVSINTEKALALPGVITVITGKEVAAHTRPLPVQANFTSKGWTWRLADVYAMPADKVRWHGEPVAAVVAEDEETARKAADLVEVTYDPLPLAGDLRTALAPGPQRCMMTGKTTNRCTWYLISGIRKKRLPWQTRCCRSPTGKAGSQVCPSSPGGVWGCMTQKMTPWRCGGHSRHHFCPGTTLPPPWEFPRQR